MSRDYLTLADRRTPTLSIECPQCGRFGRYDVAKLIERLDEVKRRRIGPMQILEGEHHRLRPSPGQKKGDHRGKLPPTHLLGAEFQGAFRGQWNIEQRRK